MPYHAGSFLIAKSTLSDPYFTQTVVLLLQHNADGAFGLVVNKPAKSEELPFPVFNGGPCTSEGVIMLHGQPDWLDDAEESEGRSVAPGIFVGSTETFQRIIDDPPEENARYRIFACYSGWGPDQLETELATGSWAVVPASGDLLFDTPVEELWDRLLPPSFPQPSVN